MLLGNKTDLEAETKSLYQKSGISHLLAISGLHVSVFGMTLYRFLRKMGGSLRSSGALSLFVVLFYGFLTGMGTSACRAVVMFALLIIGEMLGKSYDMLDGPGLWGNSAAFAAATVCAQRLIFVVLRGRGRHRPDFPGPESIVSAKEPQMGENGWNRCF